MLVERCDALVLHGPEQADAVAPLVRELRTAGGAEVLYVRADFTSLEAVPDAARTVRQLAPRPIDLLINTTPPSPEHRRGC